MADNVVLVTGGLGFIGSHLVEKLVRAGRSVRVLDAIEPQVHGSSAGNRISDAEYLEASVLDRDAVRSALDGVGAVVHLAAQVGVGQSMYDMERYVRDNCLGTAVLLEELAQRRRQVRSLVVASSMSIYGEGRYACETCGVDDTDVVRALEHLTSRHWEPTCVRCGSEARPLPTPETKRLSCDSVYAISKRDQEELCLVVGRSYGVRTVALRFFNVFGPRQSLSNPYTGVAAIFVSRLLNGRAPTVFEDGLQSRDFVHASDIAGAIELALEATDVGDIALNLGTGRPTTVLDVAGALSEELGVDLQPDVVHRFRHGDIRHCYADIGLARNKLGYAPGVSFREGMKELVAWIRTTAPQAHDASDRSTAELVERGLVV